MLASTIIESTLEPLTSADRINVLILDDSIYHHELPDVCIAQALRLLVSLFAKRIQEHPMYDEGKIQEQLELFLSEVPSLLSQKLRKCA